MKVTTARVRDWLDSPIAELLIIGLNRQIQRAYTERAEFFLHDDPVSTHVKRAITLGEERAYEDIIEFLKGDEDMILEFLAPDLIDIEVEDTDDD